MHLAVSNAPKQAMSMASIAAVHRRRIGVPLCMWHPGVVGPRVCGIQHRGIVHLDCSRCDLASQTNIKLDIRKRELIATKLPLVIKHLSSHAG